MYNSLHLSLQKAGTTTTSIACTYIDALLDTLTDTLCSSLIQT